MRRESADGAGTPREIRESSGAWTCERFSALSCSGVRLRASRPISTNPHGPTFRRCCAVFNTCMSIGRTGSGGPLDAGRAGHLGLGSERHARCLRARPGGELLRPVRRAAAGRHRPSGPGPPAPIPEQGREETHRATGCGSLCRFPGDRDRPPAGPPFPPVPGRPRRCGKRGSPRCPGGSSAPTGLPGNGTGSEDPVPMTAVRMIKEKSRRQEWAPCTRSCSPACRYRPWRRLDRGLNRDRIRWRIEDGRRVLNSGCKAEFLNHQESHRIERAVTIEAVIAGRLFAIVLLGWAKTRPARRGPVLPYRNRDAQGFSPLSVRFRADPTTWDTPCTPWRSSGPSQPSRRPRARAHVDLARVHPVGDDGSNLRTPVEAGSIQRAVRALTFRQEM